MQPKHTFKALEKFFSFSFSSFFFFKFITVTILIRCWGVVVLGKKWERRNWTFGIVVCDRLQAYTNLLYSSLKTIFLYVFLFL